MNKKQFFEYTNKILKGSNHLATDKMIGTLFLEYSRDRRHELVDKVNRLSVVNEQSLEDFIGRLTGLVAGDETIIMTLNTIANDTTFEPEKLKRMARKITDKYINGLISKNNSTYGDLK